MKKEQSPKKVEPPPKLQDPVPVTETPKLDQEGNPRRANPLKSVRQLKEELGPLTEEAKVDLEEAMNELRSIIKIKRRTFFQFLLDKVAFSLIPAPHRLSRGG